jgi:hypothetical protein
MSNQTGHLFPPKSLYTYPAAYVYFIYLSLFSILLLSLYSILIGIN